MIEDRLLSSFLSQEEDEFDVDDSDEESNEEVEEEI